MVHLAEQRAAFVGVARDCGRFLEGALANVGRFARLYCRSSFVFVVSDCIDDTPAILRRWIDEGRDGVLIDLGNIAGRLPHRTLRIAYARNLALDTIQQHAHHIDHLVVVDLDDVLAKPISVENFACAAAWLNADPQRVAAFANAEPLYYDIWALRHDTWCPGDCWHAIWYRHGNESFGSAKVREVFNRQVKIPPTAPPIRVNSAFGGLGIYKFAAVHEARYRGLDDDGREIAEHVAFNAKVGRRGGLYIIPSLRVAAPRQHLYQSDLRTLVAYSRGRWDEWRRPLWRTLVGSTEPF